LFVAWRSKAGGVYDLRGELGAGLASLSYASSPQSLIDLFFQDSHVVAAGLRPAFGLRPDSMGHWNMADG